MKIFGQIQKIMTEMEAIGKDSKNATQGFKFRGIDAVYNELHTRFAEHGVFTVPEVLSFTQNQKQTKSGALMNYTIAHIRYRFYADDGSYFDASVIGEGADSGDKSANKSMAIAHKYALLQVFCIPTEDPPGDPKDPDAQSHEVGAPPKSGDFSSDDWS